MLVPPQVNGVLLDMTGCHTLRNEFEPEHDNAAENSMAELEFREDDLEVRLHARGFPACSASRIYPCLIILKRKPCILLAPCKRPCRMPAHFTALIGWKHICQASNGL